MLMSEAREVEMRVVAWCLGLLLACSEGDPKTEPVEEEASGELVDAEAGSKALAFGDTPDRVGLLLPSH